MTNEEIIEYLKSLGYENIKQITYNTYRARLSFTTYEIVYNTETNEIQSTPIMEHKR